MLQTLKIGDKMVGGNGNILKFNIEYINHYHDLDHDYGDSKTKSGLVCKGLKLMASESLTSTIQYTLT